MNQEQAIELEMRLNAIEYVLTKLCVMLIQASGISDDQIAEQRRELLTRASGQIFSGLDPALSDLASAEWARAIERLLDMQGKMLGDLRVRPRSYRVPA